MVIIGFGMSANAQSKQSDIVGVWEGNYDEGGGTCGKGTLTLTINDDMNGVIEFVIKRRSEELEGSYTVSVNKSKGVYNVTGKEFIKKTNNYGFDNFSGSVNKDVFRGKNFQFKRIATAEQLREQQAERERQLQEQQVEQERQLQAQKAKQERYKALMLIGFGVFLILIIVITARYQQKANEKRKECQVVFDEIFRKEGFSSTDIVCTNGKLDKDFNTLFGANNGKLIFFGGGSKPLNIETKNGKLMLYGAKNGNWEKLSEEGDFLLTVEAAKTLFPKKNALIPDYDTLVKFRHLFDIPMKNIKNIKCTSREDVRILGYANVVIEYYDASNQFTEISLSFDDDDSFETANTIREVLIKMKENIMTQGEISRTNNKICQIIKNRIDKQKREQNENMGCLVAIFGLIITVATLGLVRGLGNASRDIGR